MRGETKLKSTHVGFGTMNDEQPFVVEKIILDVVKYYTSTRVDTKFFNPNNAMMSSHKHMDALARDIVLTFEQSIAQMKVDNFVFSKPSSWWQHLKEEHAPKWFLKKFPVKYINEKYDVKALYPSIIIPDHQEHIIFQRVRM